MRWRITILMLGVLLYAGGLAQAGTWNTLDYPGAVATYIEDIDGGNIVGSYTDTSNYTHGFLYNGSTWITLNMPGASGTSVIGISGDNIIGYGYTNPPGDAHKFLYNNGNWNSLDGTIHDMIYDIDGSIIVGGQSIYNINTQTSKILNMPGSIVTEIRCISGSNLVGWYASNYVSGPYTFLYDGINWSTLFTVGNDIAPNGIDGSNLVGSVGGSSFLYNLNSQSWTILDMPGAINTTAGGIDGSNIVGSYIDTSYNRHGFVYTIPEPASVLMLGLGLPLIRAFVKRKRQTGTKN